MVTAAKIAQLVAGQLIGDGNKQVSGLGELASASAEQLSFLREKKHLKTLQQSKAGIVLIQTEIVALVTEQNRVFIVCANVDLAFAKVSQLLKKQLALPNAKGFVHTTAAIDNSATIGKNCQILSHCSIGQNTKIGNDVIIESNCSIGSNVSIGDNTHLKAGVRIEDDSQIGQHCLIQANTVIGSDGFGFAFDTERTPIKKEHFGRVIIGNCVELGSNCSIDKGAIGDTIIRDFVKFDNLVHIAHNCEIGAKSLIAANATIAGSVIIGEAVIIGGSVGIGDHVKIGDRAVIHSGSVISVNLEANKHYSSKLSGMEFSKWRYNIVAFKRINEMLKDIKLIKRHIQIDKK